MTQAIAIAQPEGMSLSREADQLAIEEVVARVQKVQEVQRRIMRPDVHYGKIPGTPKPTLLKPGAELLGMTFRLDPQFEVAEQIRDGEHLTIVMRCTLYHAPSGARMGSGMGSCSTRESKYAWRKGERSCPKCGSSAIIKGKEEYGGGWVCFGKKGGCGAKYGDKDPAIVAQNTGRVPNEDVADQHNTVLKMACKRAHVAAILFVTCASEIFTQDVEDMPRGTSVAAMVAEEEPYDPEQESPFPRLRAQLDKLEELTAKCTTYEEALTIRAELGSKAKPAEALLTREMQEAIGKGQGPRTITQAEAGELGRTWQRIDRQLTKREKELATSVEAHFISDERQPGDDG